MKPVSFCEIVVGQGEYLYRKGSNLIWTPSVFLVESRYRVLGVRVISLAHSVSASVVQIAWLRPLPRYRHAVGSQCGVSVLKVAWTPRVRASDMR